MDCKCMQIQFNLPKPNNIKSQPENGWLEVGSDDSFGADGFFSRVLRPLNRWNKPTY